MQVQAKAKYIRVSPRKSRLVIDLIRGLSIEDARAQLKFSTKNAAKPILKVLNSAIANATNNLKIDESTLNIVKAYIDEGPTFHRFKPRAQGRATAIRKRMSHITVIVGDGKETVKTVEKEVSKDEVKAPAKKVATKKAVAKKVVSKKPSDSKLKDKS